MCLKDAAIKSGKNIIIWLPLLAISGSAVNFGYGLQAKTDDNSKKIDYVERITFDKIDAVDRKHDQKCTDTRAIIATNVKAIDEKLDIVLDFIKEKHGK